MTEAELDKALTSPPDMPHYLWAKEERDRGHKNKMLRAGLLGVLIAALAILARQCASN